MPSLQWIVRTLLTLSAICCVQVKCVKERPLILTHLLYKNKISEARTLARVVPDMEGTKSYTGFFTVNEKCGTHYFFWLILSEKNWEKAPVLLVTDGSSALISMFRDFGPFKHFKKQGFVKNKFHWGKSNNLLFIDQPAGTGFSFSEHGCHADNMTVIAEETHTALVQFYKLFPNLKNNKLFIVGQTFASKFALPIAYEIDRKHGHNPINLKGIILGNPLLDARCERLAYYLYELGIFDENHRDKRLNFLKKFVKLIDEKKYKQAFNLSEETNTVTTDISFSYTNILMNGAQRVSFAEFEYYIRSYSIRKQIHVGNVPYNIMSDPDYNFLDDDMLIPSTPELAHFLGSKKYLLVFYYGQLTSTFTDAELPCALKETKWRGYKQYYAANRTEWYIGDQLVGWFKTSGNLVDVVIRNSGVNVLSDQPKAALQLINTAVTYKIGSKAFITEQP